MKFNFSGALEIRIPEEKSIEIEAEDQCEAINKLLTLIADDEVEVRLVRDYLKIKRIRKIFTVYVEETFRNRVEIDTEEYPFIMDEDDAASYVENHMDEFISDFEYDAYSSIDDTDIRCEDYDTEEIEEDD